MYFFDGLHPMDVRSTGDHPAVRSLMVCSVSSFQEYRMGMALERSTKTRPRRKVVVIAPTARMTWTYFAVPFHSIHRTASAGLVLEALNAGRTVQTTAAM